MVDISANIVQIDGSYLEGGGQILRIASALSALLIKNIHVTKIRAGRPNPGLRPQHLKGLEIIQSLCGGVLKGAVLESTEVTLLPGKIKAGEFEADTHTAGSIPLLIQIALPCAIFAEAATTLKIKGGTNTEMAPQIDYLTQVFSSVLDHFGIIFDCKIIKRGYYPRGGGEVHIKIDPVNTIEPVILMERGHIQKVYGSAFVAGKLPIEDAQTIANSAIDVLKKYFEEKKEDEAEDEEEDDDECDEEKVIGEKDVELKIEAYKEKDGDAVGTCSGINIFALTSTGLLLGGSALGKRDMLPKQVGVIAASQLIDDIECGACVDKHSQDQIVVFMALAYGGSEVRVGPITEHTRTAICICEKLTLARFNVINKGPTFNIIQCVGHGFKNINDI